MSTMARVSRKHVCPVCKHGDWCLVGKTVIICMRTPSDRTKTFADGSVGWLHRLDGQPLPEFKPRKSEVVNKPAINMDTLWGRWYLRTQHQNRVDMAKDLGVTLKSMELIGAAQRDPLTWAFPMRDAYNRVCGIRLRDHRGNKWAVVGSKQGLFIPQCDPEPLVFIPEGPTNTAAVLSMGRYAVGRPSANGAVLTAAEAVRRLGCRRAVIVADTDPDRVRPNGSVFNPGSEGADLLASHLKVDNCTLLLPCKDMRDFVKGGGDAATLDYMVKQCIWRKP